MKPPDYNDITGLLFKVHELPNGSKRFELCREAVRKADELGNEHLRFVARLWLIEAAGNEGHAEIQLIEAAWCIGAFERDPEKFASTTVSYSKNGSHRLLGRGMGIHWTLKGVLGSLPDFPDISREQIDQAFAQAEGLYERQGLNRHALHYYRAIVAREMGDEKLCRAEILNWRTTPRDESSDCPACELRHEMKFLLWEGRDEDAIAIAAPLIEGTQRCQGGDRAMLPHLFHPLTRLKRIEEAVGIHHASLARALEHPRETLAHIAQHLGLLTVTGNYEWAEELAWRNLPHALGRKDAQPPLLFFSGIRAFLIARQKRTGATRFHGELPEAVPVRRGGNGYSADELVSWLSEQIEAMCSAFDRRNGNRWMTGYAEESCRWFGEFFIPRRIARP